ncbi:MAG TPA: FAD-binding oxidoreductase [Candidatus Polarisedimenticolia bacterium]|nr:FAD-binding oxidoreductase [Candidatus Polarisedimenticolia bacterium]
MYSAAPHDPWGAPPWEIDFTLRRQPLPPSVDFAVIGGGFTGLAAAAWLRLQSPERSVVVVEAGRIGAGSSGRTGGMVLAESAAGDLPGLGDVLAGMARILEDLGRACGFSLAEECELALGGAWEIGRSGGRADSPVAWNDSGTLRVVNEVPGGTLNPGKLVSSLARAAVQLGATVIEDAPVERVDWSAGADLQLARGRVRAGKILFATNALSLRLSGLDATAHPMLALASLIAPLGEKQIEAIGLAERKPFYTVDFPYLWGRVRRDNSVLWGAGLVDAPDSRDIAQIDITAQEPASMFALLERRVRGLHPALAAAEFTHRWGGPLLFGEDWRPVFARHPANPNGIVLGAYAGHGIAQSVHLGAWAAEALLGRRELPEWGRINPA